MENYDNKKKNNFLTILLYGFLTILALVIIYLYYSMVLPYVFEVLDEQKNEDSLDTEYLYQEFVSGDRLQAVERMQELMERDFFEVNEGVDLKLLYANYIYRNSANSNKAEAKNIVSNLIEEVTVNSSDRVEAIRLFINFAYSDPDLFSGKNDDFSYGVNFSDLNKFNSEYGVLLESEKPEDWHESLKILADYAHSIEPHSYTAMFLASWYSGQLSKLENNDLIDDYANLVNSYVDEADILLEKENKLGYVSPGLQWNKVNFYYWKGEALANLEIIGKPTNQSFEIAFSRAIKLQDFFNENNRLTYADLSMTARFIYAIYLNEIYGGDREGEVSALLREFVEISSYNNRASDDFKNLASNLKMTHDYKGSSVHDLANINEGFEKYLVELGWNFEEIN